MDLFHWSKERSGRWNWHSIEQAERAGGAKEEHLQLGDAADGVVAWRAGFALDGRVDDDAVVVVGVVGGGAGAGVAADVP